MICKKLLLFIFLLIINLNAQNFTEYFNFYLPSSDTSTQKFLPQFPVNRINDNEFVSIDSEGKFSVAGKRIRFWGTNFGADNAFPPRDKAGLLAGRLRKFGFNLVRMHHLDNPWSRRSLVGKSDTRMIDPAYLDTLEYIIARLKENGIYVNMNLHVSRTFRIFDGVVDYDSLPEFGKGVNFFDPYIKKLHKEYAQQLLKHINPYTGKPLVDDPVMAMVEITNENSLYKFWRDNQLKPISKGGVLPYYYSKMLDSLWNEFLFDKYKSTQNLQNAWNKGIIPFGQNEQIKNGGFENPNPRNYWALEEHNGADADTARDNSVAFKGAYSFKVFVNKATGTDWHIQFKMPSATIIKDSSYTLSFAARSDSLREINVSIMNDNSPWNSYGWYSINLNTNWQTFSFSIKAPENNAGHTRLSFSLGKETGTFWFDEISFTKAGVIGLEENESLELKNIARIDYAKCVQYSDQRVKDMSEFYITLERNYFKEMISYLKDTLGVKVPVVGTNWNVGAADLASMSDADYVDNHAYWDHPQFPGEPWSSTNWLINNTPMVKDVNGGTIPYLYAGVPIAGKPFTVSEYNHPFPNRYQVESILFSAGYSSFNDADAFMYFDYSEAFEWEKDFIGGFFGINRNSVLMSFFPTISYVFRNGLIKPSANPIKINYTIDTLYVLPKNDASNWYGPSFYDRKISLVHSIKTENYFSTNTTDFKQLPQVAGNLYKTDTDEIVWNMSDGTLTIATQKFNGITGYLSKLKGKRIGEMYIEDILSQDDFATLTWLSLDNYNLSSSKKSLITLGTKIQNTEMIWNGTTTLNNNWGHSPTRIYPFKIKLDLMIYADSIKIYPLDNKGKEISSQAFVLKPYTINHFLLNLDQTVYKTLWFGIECYGEGIRTELKESRAIPQEYKLEQNFPNPFNSSTVIRYQIPDESNVTIKLYDVLGREVQTLVNEFKPAGFYEYKLNAENITSGIYFYTLNAGNHITTKKLILMK
ncbi:T9SS type A sorting domain-containing protein [Rosettibacter firmus]|uniref:T9SS type A sorting domain-containing protein n=1 Tax=Rosettibacter firmus TaxID=3111522 RepID=UPI00336BC63F